MEFQLANEMHARVKWDCLAILLPRMENPVGETLEDEIEFTSTLHRSS